MSVPALVLDNAIAKSFEKQHTHFSFPLFFSFGFGFCFEEMLPRIPCFMAYSLFYYLDCSLLPSGVVHSQTMLLLANTLLSAPVSFDTLTSPVPRTELQFSFCSLESKESPGWIPDSGF